jgi:hypothetical protein
VVRDLAVSAANTPVEQDEVEVDQVKEGVSYGQSCCFLLFSV